MFLLLSLILFSTINVQDVEFGLASRYNDKVFACPKASYKNTHLPVAASRTLSCGTIVNIKRVDTGIIVRAVIGDVGPFGVCIEAHKNTRACGRGYKWINGSKLFKSRKKPINSINWRGVLDMTPALAKKLNAKNSLIPVVIFTDLANNLPFIVSPDDIDDPKIARNYNDFNRLSLIANK